MLITTLLIWITFATVEGWREALYFHCKAGRTVKTIDEHIIFTGLRLLVFGLIVMQDISLWYVFLCLVLMFPFFHDGMYYTMRNELNGDVYPLRWRDWSTTSTAKLTKWLCWENRLIFFLCGFIWYLYFTIFAV